MLPHCCCVAANDAERVSVTRPMHIVSCRSEQRPPMHAFRLLLFEEQPVNLKESWSRLLFVSLRHIAIARVCSAWPPAFTRSACATSCQWLRCWTARTGEPPLLLTSSTRGWQHLLRADISFTLPRVCSHCRTFHRMLSRSALLYTEMCACSMSKPIRRSNLHVAKSGSPQVNCSTAT